MAETWNDEEYYDDDSYYDEYYVEAAPRTWSTLALILSGCIGLVVGFACAACIGLVLGGTLLFDSGGGTPEVARQEPRTAQEWADVLKQAGLEAENLRLLTAVGGELPPGSLTGVEFDMLSYCEGCGGKIIVFESPEYVVPMADWLQGLGQYVYTRDTVLIQIDRDVPPDIALQYRAVLLQY